jgi:transcriptional regulator with XRE-family HTH domain
MRRKNTISDPNSVDISSTERVSLSTLHLMLAIEMDEIRGRIRAARLSRGWSLADFHNHSGGAITAVAMGSYERGSRTLSISKVLVICHTLNVSLIHILAPTQLMALTDSPGRHIYDLRALQELPHSSEKIQLLAYIQHIIRERGDWKGAVISLRGSDIENLDQIFQASHDIKAHSYMEWLDVQGIRLQKN